MKKWLKYLVYVSVIFLIYSLWKADYLYVPEVKNFALLVFSVILLIAGYLTKSKVWQAGLKSKNHPVRFHDSVISTGLAELGKYIPGKVWVILGRAGYISGKYSVSTTQASGISLVVQFITIWSGILVALAGIIFIKVPAEWIIALVAGWLLLSFVLFFRPFHKWVTQITSKIIKKEIHIPFIEFKEIRPVLHWFFIDWAVRMSGFYLFLLALSGYGMTFAVAAGFPLAVTLGILAVIAPGGIGVREGILVIWLQGAGLELAEATTLAINTRLWALAGEITIFVAAWILNKIKK